MKELKKFQIEKFKNKLIKLRDDLVEKFKKINRTEKVLEIIMGLKMINFMVSKTGEIFLIKTMIMTFMKELNTCLSNQ